MRFNSITESVSSSSLFESRSSSSRNLESEVLESPAVQNQHILPSILNMQVHTLANGDQSTRSNVSDSSQEGTREIREGTWDAGLRSELPQKSHHFAPKIMVSNVMSLAPKMCEVSEFVGVRMFSRN